MRYKLIVADSSPSVQKSIQLSFPRSTFEIFPFEDGKEVIKNIGQIKPDAILLSLFLPGVDGYEVGLYLKNQEELRKISIIFLKGAFEALDKQKMAALVYEKIVRKPFDSEKLAQKVKDIVEKKKDPLTFPEEPIVEEMNLKKQVFEIEKELEEKIRNRILQDIKESFGREIEGLKTEISELKNKGTDEEK